MFRPKTVIPVIICFCMYKLLGISLLKSSMVKLPLYGLTHLLFWNNFASVVRPWTELFLQSDICIMLAPKYYSSAIGVNSMVPTFPQSLLQVSCLLKSSSFLAKCIGFSVRPGCFSQFGCRYLVLALIPFTLVHLSFLAFIFIPLNLYVRDK